ncbi:MAG: transcription termination/antitermination protein NusG, partial [Mycobacterium sp.]|nr:transcription termination/antitermination protein NusG [Mycobacterium sp.]
MTSFDGEAPSGDTVDTVDVDETTSQADTDAETLNTETMGSETLDTGAVDTDQDAAPAEVADETDGADAAATPDEDEDPAVALKKELRLKPGEWYVIHSYAGYENKVKANLETRVQNLDVGDYIFQVEVPTEEVTEIKNGQRKQVNRKVLPG